MVSTNIIFNFFIYCKKFKYIKIIILYTLITMFHYDPTDYLCPVYLQKNATQTYGFQHVPDKSSSRNTIMKVSPTSA